MLENHGKWMGTLRVTLARRLESFGPLGDPLTGDPAMIRSLFIVAFTLVIALNNPVAAQPPAPPTKKGSSLPPPPPPSPKSTPSTSADTTAILAAITSLKTELKGEISALKTEVSAMKTKVDEALKASKDAKAAAMAAKTEAGNTTAELAKVLKKLPPPQPDLPLSFTGSVRLKDGSYQEVQVGVVFAFNGDHYIYHEGSLKKHDPKTDKWHIQN